MSIEELERSVSRIISQAMDQGQRCEYPDRQLRIECYAVKAILDEVQRFERGGEP